MKKLLLTSLLLTTITLTANASETDEEAYRTEMKNKYGAGVNEAKYQNEEQKRYGSNDSGYEKQKRLRDGSGGGQMHGKSGGRGKR